MIFFKFSFIKTYKSCMGESCSGMGKKMRMEKRILKYLKYNYFI
jgi:hypothetical protein